MTSRSPRRRRTTGSSRRFSRRNLLRLALLPAAGLAPLSFPTRSRPPRSSRHVSGGGGDEAAALGTRPPRDDVDSVVEAIALGTAQDAGVPQVDCFRDFCRVVRRGDAPAPRVACLGLVDRAARRRFLVDATPDLVAQLGHLVGERSGGGSLEEELHGILLTHAHIGHYTGLVHLGQEAAATREIPLYVGRAMADFLHEDGPWSLLVRDGHVRLHVLDPGETVSLTPSLRVTPIPVVHRTELSDTLGFLLAGPTGRLLYVPDADRWDGWPGPTFDDCLDRVDTALLDGTFYDADELGHRPQEEVPHPPVRSTIERLEDRPGRPDVWFTHLNHTNPLWRLGSRARRRVEELGYGVAATGQTWAL